MPVEKQAARKAGFAQRKLAHENGKGAAQAAAAHLLKWFNIRQFSCVAGYMPIRSEIDVLPAMQLLHLRGAKICVPVIISKDMPLKFRCWTPDCPMEDGPFGARVPSVGEWLVPDLVLCPLVSFDIRGHRLGYGGGYYDRSLAEIRAAQPVTALGYAYAGQLAPDLPIEPTDQPLDGMVTESGVTLSGQ